MGGIFGKSKPKVAKDTKPVITDQDKAVLQLKQQRDKIKQYQKRIKLQLIQEKEVARELLKNNQKDKALSILKKKKRMESMLDKAEAQLETLEKMTADIEFAQIEVEVVEGLKIGNESLRELHALMSIDQIESILDETREGVEKQREIDSLLGGAFTAEEESDLMSELEQLTEEFEVKLPSVPVEDVIPDDNDVEESEEIKKPTKQRKTKERVALTE